MLNCLLECFFEGFRECFSTTFSQKTAIGELAVGVSPADQHVGGTSLINERESADFSCLRYVDVIGVCLLADVQSS